VHATDAIVGRARAVVCVVAENACHERFRDWLRSVLTHTPLERVELRLAFAQAEQSFYYALGTLIPDGGWPTRHLLPGEIERFGWTATEGSRVWAWNARRIRTREQLARLVFHDVPLEAEYAICLDRGASLEAGWWEAIAPLMEQEIDYVGRPAWHEYLPGEAERIQTQPWYMGVPLERREGRLGTAYLGGGFVAVRCERLREVEYPGEVWLGEMANQLGWTRAVFSAGVGHG
jgi:hypothetical protein